MSTSTISILRHMFLSIVTAAFPLSAFAGDAPIHGLWVWKTSSVLESPRKRAEALRNFCKARGINEVAMSSLSSKGGQAEEATRCHASHRVAA